jgi:hypothetical protein
MNIWNETFVELMVQLFEYRITGKEWQLQISNKGDMCLELFSYWMQSDKSKDCQATEFKVPGNFELFHENTPGVFILPRRQWMDFVKCISIVDGSLFDVIWRVRDEYA